MTEQEREQLAREQREAAEILVGLALKVARRREAERLAKEAAAAEEAAAATPETIESTSIIAGKEASPQA